MYERYGFKNIINSSSFDDLFANAVFAPDNTISTGKGVYLCVHKNKGKIALYKNGTLIKNLTSFGYFEIEMGDRVAFTADSSSNVLSMILYYK